MVWKLLIIASGVIFVSLRMRESDAVVSITKYLIVSFLTRFQRSKLIAWRRFKGFSQGCTLIANGDHCRFASE